MSVIRRMASLSIKATRILLSDGFRVFAGQLRTKLRAGLHTVTAGKKIQLAVSESQAIALERTNPPARLPTPVTLTNEATQIAWIVSEPIPNGGGHQNLFRFIKYAEQAGHNCSIYFTATSGAKVNLAKVTRMLSEHPGYPKLRARLAKYHPETGVAPQTQAIFATSWDTAYPAYLDKSAARRFYFVQDYEPAFYPAGSVAQLAENTYRFGFHAITAGGWLAEKLRTEFGMSTDQINLGVDLERYYLTNRNLRNEIFFYARPSTPRRGFELGVLALSQFASDNPEVTINLAGGSELDHFTLPFRFLNHRSLPVSELNAVYNRCAAALVLSFTNMSLLPLELMASGVVPVVNDAPNTRMVVNSPHISYVSPEPRAIARALREALSRVDQVENATSMSASLEKYSWDHASSQFLEAYDRVMRG